MSLKYSFTNYYEEAERCVDYIKPTFRENACVENSYFYCNFKIIVTRRGRGGGGVVS